MIYLQSHLLNASGYIIRRWICSGLVDVNCNSHYSTEQRMTIMDFLTGDMWNILPFHYPPKPDYIQSHLPRTFILINEMTNKPLKLSFLSTD